MLKWRFVNNFLFDANGINKSKGLLISVGPFVFQQRKALRCR